MIIKYLKRFIFKVFISSPIVLIMTFFALVSLENAYVFLLNFDDSQKSVCFALLVTVSWMFGALSSWILAVDSILEVNNEHKS